MRHHFSNDSRPKSVAKALRHEMKRHGFSLSHSTSLLLAAELYGYRNWSDLVANLSKHRQSPDDREAGAATAQNRFDHHVEVLSRHGIDRVTARDIVLKIGPTSAGVHQSLGREELWVDDASVIAYLDELAVGIATEASQVSLERHGTWLGFRAWFGNIEQDHGSSLWEHDLTPHSRQIVLGVSHDSRSAIFREVRRDDNFSTVVDNRILYRSRASTEPWSFLDGTRSAATQKRDKTDMVREVLSRLHVPTLRAMRSVSFIDEEDYEMVVGSDRVRSFLQRYPSLGSHCLWSLALPSEAKHLNSSKWIEKTDTDTAIMAMLTDGVLPS